MSLRNTPLTLQTDCKVDLTELPIKVFVFAVPKLIWDNLRCSSKTTMEVRDNAKIFKTDLIHLFFLKEGSY